MNGLTALGEDYGHNLRYTMKFSVPLDDVLAEDYSRFSSIDDARVLAYYKAFRQAIDDRIRLMESTLVPELTGDEPMLGGK